MWDKRSKCCAVQRNTAHLVTLCICVRCSFLYSMLRYKTWKGASGLNWLTCSKNTQTRGGLPSLETCRWQCLYLSRAPWIPLVPADGRPSLQVLPRVSESHSILTTTKCVLHSKTNSVQLFYMYGPIWLSVKTTLIKVLKCVELHVRWKGLQRNSVASYTHQCWYQLNYWGFLHCWCHSNFHWCLW